MHVLHLQNLLWHFPLSFREKKGDCLSRLTVLPHKTENIQDQESVFIHFHRDTGYQIGCKQNRIRPEQKILFCFPDHHKFCQHFLLKYTKSSIVKAKPPIPENTFIFSCFLFSPKFPSLSSVGLLKHDYVIVTVENSEFIAVCAGSITDISEEEVVLLTERYENSVCEL